MKCIYNRNSRRAFFPHRPSVRLLASGSHDSTHVGSIRQRHKLDNEPAHALHDMGPIPVHPSA